VFLCLLSNRGLKVLSVLAKVGKAASISTSRIGRVVIRRCGKLGICLVRCQARRVVGHGESRPLGRAIPTFFLDVLVLFLAVLGLSLPPVVAEIADFALPPASLARWSVGVVTIGIYVRPGNQKLVVGGDIHWSQVAFYFAIPTRVAGGARSASECTRGMNIVSPSLISPGMNGLAG
jgi:hypothetical protein